MLDVRLRDERREPEAWGFWMKEVGVVVVVVICLKSEDAKAAQLDLITRVERVESFCVASILDFGKQTGRWQIISTRLETHLEA